MSGVITAVAVAATVASTAYSAISSGQQADATKKAADQQAAAANQQLQTETDQINKANAKSPDTSAISSANQNAAKGGASGTLLTGVGGVDPSKLTLGKTTLLGG